MKIVNYSEITKMPDALETLLSKLKSASFADECRYRIADYGRRFCCIFVKDEQYSKEYSCHVKYLSTLVNDISILEGKSKDIDPTWKD